MAENYVSRLVRTINSRFFGILGLLYKNPRPSLNAIDRKLEKYLDFKGGVFIEAGANDGYSQSNTYFLERSMGWTGVLVEGIPELYSQCKKARPASAVVNCALVSDNYPHSSIAMQYAGLMSVVDGTLGSDSACSQHVQTGIEIQGIRETYRVETPARTLTSVLDDVQGLPEIDFFSLDVEGYEIEVLKGLNFDKYAPRFLLVESREPLILKEFLSDRYDFVEQFSEQDFFFKLKP